MSIMVTGATGMFGGAVLEKLLELGEKPLGVTRSESKGERLRAKGAVPVVGDLSEPRKSWTPSRTRSLSSTRKQ